MILVVLLCLSGSPGECETVREPLLAEVTPWQCAAKAQEHIARMTTDGLWRGYEARRWGCRLKDRA